MPYRSRIQTPVAPANGQSQFGESVFAWFLIVVGAGRVFQALWLYEVWGAEASICLALLVLGTYELVRIARSNRRTT